jgi:predicted RNA binding protein YcfA (HicA-like mRNA interferase family)
MQVDVMDMIPSSRIDPVLYRRRYSRKDLEELAQTKQPTRTEELERILIIHGFEKSNQVGSHIHFKHPWLPNQKPTTLIASHHGTDHAAVNKCIASACLQIRDLRRKYETESTFAMQFQTHASNTHTEAKHIESLENLPSDITGHTAQDQNESTKEICFIRHKAHTCIGIIIPAQTTAEQRDVYLKDVRERAKKLNEELIASQELYEVDYVYDKNQNLLIGSLPYSFGFELPPYEPEDEIDPFRELELF